MNTGRAVWTRMKPKIIRPAGMGKGFVHFLLLIFLFKEKIDFRSFKNIFDIKVVESINSRP